MEFLFRHIHLKRPFEETDKPPADALIEEPTESK